ncbi:MAG: caspase family protein [Actinomycetota bacterium]
MPSRAVSLALPVVLALSACGDRVERPDPVPLDQAVSQAVPEAAPDETQGAGEHGSGGRRHGKGRHGAAGPVEAEPPPPPELPAGGAGGGVRLPGTATLRGDRIAVIVGINDYPGEDGDLTAAVADARLVRRALVRMGFGRIVFLLNGEATRDSILWSAEWLARRSRPGTVGAFFYAGHVRQVSGDPDGDGEDVDEAIVGSDGRLLLDGELARALEGATGPLWLAFASCYAAGFSDTAGPRRVSSYASDEESLAYESVALGHSFMVEYLVRRAMLGAGITSVEGAHAHAWRQMRGDARRFRPLMDDRVRGTLELGAAGPPPQPQPGAQGCLVVLRCGS